MCKILTPKVHKITCKSLNPVSKLYINTHISVAAFNILDIAMNIAQNTDLQYTLSGSNIKTYILFIMKSKHMEK